MSRSKPYIVVLKLAFVVAYAVLGTTACRTLGQIAAPKFPTYDLQVEASWRLDSPVGRFDASGIERGPNGEILVVRDTELAVFEVRFDAGSDRAALVRQRQYSVNRSKLDVGVRRFDIEGLAVDDKGALMACDEFARRVLRFRGNGHLEALPIDFSAAEQFFSGNDQNASFEGIAFGNGRLYLANERSRGKLIEVDLDAGSVVACFEARTGTSAWPDPHYSGLDFHNGKLFALLREEQAVVEVDPKTKTVDRVFRYHSVEFDRQHRYRTVVPLAGVMEGLLVEDGIIWLLTDNNGRGRYADKNDHRPTLFRCSWDQSNPVNSSQ